MAFVLPLRFKQALALYLRHVQAHQLSARAISESVSHRAQGTWILCDKIGNVARVRANGTVLMIPEGAR